MNKQIRYAALFLLAIMAVYLGSCKKKKPKDDFSNIKGTYLSINQYILDEWNHYSGMPFVIIKSTRLNKGRMDTTVTNSDTINWAPIFETFSNTDISNRKYLGQYKFSAFDDNQDGTHNFIYLANDADLFTQKLLVTIDQRTSKVTGIYIETFKKSATNEKSQKLYYNPLKTIQIQTEEKPLMGEGTYYLQQWTFMR